MDSATTQTAVVAEVTQGTTPASPAFKVTARIFGHRQPVARRAAFAGAQGQSPGGEHGQRAGELRQDDQWAVRARCRNGYLAGLAILLDLVDERPEGRHDEIGLHARAEIRERRYRPVSPPRRLPLRLAASFVSVGRRRRPRHDGLQYPRPGRDHGDDGLGIGNLRRAVARRRPGVVDRCHGERPLRHHVRRRSCRST